ncbi:MAG: hypothetical protein HQK49_09805 [Oligoflexia bacterium]|nr:hypothetical protein [Oligoflexia bacterium]
MKKNKRIKILILITFLVLSLLSVVVANASIANASIDETKVANAFLFNAKVDNGDIITTEEEKMNAFLKLINITSQTVAVAAAMDSSRQGLGTKYPCEPNYMLAKKLDANEKIFASSRCEGPIFQLLRTISYADNEFLRALVHDKQFIGLPKSAFLLAAPLSLQDVDKIAAGNLLDENIKKLVDKVTNMVNDPKFSKVMPEMAPLIVKNVIGVEDNKNLHQQIKKGISDYLQELKGVTKNDNDKGVESNSSSTSNSGESAELDLKKIEEDSARLKTMLKAFKPIFTLALMNIKDQKNAKGSLFVESYFPPLHELITEGNGEDASGWYLRKGIRDFKPKESVLNISLADFNNLSYLKGAKQSDDHIIKINMLKDFEKKDQIKLWVNFGRLKNSDSSESTSGSTIDFKSLDPDKGIMDVDSTKPEDALILSGKVRLESTANDAAITAKIKQIMNSLISSYKLDVRIHKLTAILNRPAKDSRTSISIHDSGDILGEDLSIYDPAPNPYQMDIKVADSLLSFRVRADDLSASDLPKQKRMGFHCERIAGGVESVESGGEKYNCYQDFANWADFQSKFLNRLFTFSSDDPNERTAFATLLDSTFRVVASNVVYYIVKKVIDWYFPEIEKDIDKQINKMKGGIPELLESFSDSVSKIKNKLDELSKTIPKDLVK